MCSVVFSDGVRTARFEASEGIGRILTADGFGEFTRRFWSGSASLDSVAFGSQVVCDGGVSEDVGDCGRELGGESVYCRCVRCRRFACGERLGGSGNDVGTQGVRASDGVVDASQPVVTSQNGGSVERGKHYFKNKAKKEKRRLMSQSWRSGISGGARIAPTVCTVDTRTAVEVEAAQTLAARRVAENKVAEALAAHKLRALSDRDRTAMVDRLAAARGEQRINEARAKSQASFKKCDESLKSLGSSGSAGEFALKQELKRAKDNEKTHEYVKRQLTLALKYVSAEGMQLLAELPAPVFDDEMEVFGGCPSDYDEDEQEAYFVDVNQRNADAFDREYSHA